MTNFAWLRTPFSCLAGTGLFALSCALSAGASWADGALAMGTTGAIAKDGLAMGWAVEHKTKESAEQTALAHCRAYKDAPQRTRDRCRLISTFANECVSIVLDPKAGTPGAGWAVAGTSQIAQKRASAACKATAGKGRENYCTDTTLKCDGDAK